MLTQSQAGAPAKRLRFGIPTTDLTMLLVVLIWGANFSVMKVALLQIPPLMLSALRFGVGALLLWLIMRMLEGPRDLDRKTLGKLTWIGVIGNTGYQICFSYGLTITTAANGALLIATVPAMVALAGALLGIERINRAIAAGIVLAFTGVFFILSSRGLAFSIESLAGDLLMLTAAVAWTIYTLGVRTLGNELSPLRITTWTMITGAPILVLIAIPEMLATDWGSIEPAAWGGLLYATLLALVLAYFLWNNSVRVAGSNRTAIYGTVIPLVAALVAWPLLGEQPTWMQAVGGTLIIAGVLLTRRR